MVIMAIVGDWEKAREKSAYVGPLMYASDAGRKTGNREIQIHGGVGFVWGENDLHLYYRRARASETAFGDAIFHRERIARQVIDARLAAAIE